MPRALGRLRLRSPPWKLRQLRKLPSSEAHRIAANIVELSDCRRSSRGLKRKPSRHDQELIGWPRRGSITASTYPANAPPVAICRGRPRRLRAIDARACNHTEANLAMSANNFAPIPSRPCDTREEAKFKLRLYKSIIIA